MNYLLKFLISNLRTLDGEKGSANKLLDLMNETSMEDYKVKHKRDVISESVRLRIIHINEHKVFRKTFMKYLIMRVRAKISFMALSKRMTVLELFATAIHKTYHTL